MANDKNQNGTTDENANPSSNVMYNNPAFDDGDEDAQTQPLLSDSKPPHLRGASSIEEVSVNISNTDDPSTPCVTIRAVVLGCLLTALTAFTSQFFAFRTSPLDLNVGIVILIAFVIGKILTLILPKSIWKLNINFTPFNEKELALMAMMATSGTKTYEGLEVLTIQRLVFQFHLQHVCAIFFLIIMHMLAISIAGILQKYTVWPSFMLWPKAIMGCSLIRTLVNENNFEKDKSRWKMSRARFYCWILLFEFIYYWLPGYMFPLLSYFSLFCFFDTSNVVYSQVTGAMALGAGSFELDWNAWVAFLDSPILVPVWAHVHIFIGFVIVAWIATPLFYYLNVWDSKRLPILSNRVFDQYGNFYNVSRVLDVHSRVNFTAVNEYSTGYLTAGFVVSRGFLAAGITALIMHAILYHGKGIYKSFRTLGHYKSSDIHAKLMSAYPDVPDYIYFCLMLLAFTGALFLNYYSNMMPASMMPLAILLTFILALPNTTITAITNMTLTMSFPNDLIAGLFTPGNPIAYLTFHVYSYTCQNQILLYQLNKKVGHYMKVPHRATFLLFVLAAVITCCVQYGTAVYLLNNVPNICTNKNPEWKCPTIMSTETGAIIFTITNSFYAPSPYSPILIGFLIGAGLPLISWYISKRFPKVKWLSYINFPVVLMAINPWPPAPSSEYISFFLVGMFFNYFLYRRAHDWWEKYAYIFSVAMSTAVAISSIVIFFSVQLNGVKFPTWWGMGGPTGDGCPLDGANFTGYIPQRSDL